MAQNEHDMPNFRIVEPYPQMSTVERERFLEHFQDDLELTTDPEMSKFLMGKALVVLTRICGFSLVRAWRTMRPSDHGTHEAIKKKAYRWRKHHEAKYPLGINEALEVSGIKVQDITDMSAGMLRATKWVWDEKTKTRVPSEEPDWNARDKAAGRIMGLVKMDKDARHEFALGREEASKMRLDTGPKFETAKEWLDWMEGQHEIVIKERADAARDMKLIAEGRRIIQEEGKDAAELMKQIARERGEK